MQGKLKYNIPYDLDSPERTIYHRQIITRKLFLNRLYREWYGVLSEARKNLPPGIVVELGSGGGFLKDLEPDVICSDVLELPGNDMTFSALEMPFRDNEVSAVFMIDTFHHIPDSEQFLNEVNRVLKKDGMLIMIEPANSLWGRFIYRNFHHEPFNPDGDWKIPSAGPLSGANGALPWIVFERDYKKFMEQYPNLKLVEKKYHTPLRYLLSGGVSFRQLFPNFTYSLFRQADRFLSLGSKQVSMFVTIKIIKI